VDFEKKNPLLCIKAKIFLVNAKKCIKGKMHKNVRKQVMMRNAHHRKKNPCMVLLIYKLQYFGFVVNCKDQI
jgi:hypothetical protein